MKQLMNLAGSTAALLGILICAGSGLARLSGLYYISGHQVTTIFIVGVGLMVFACLAKLEVLLSQQ